MKYDLSVPLRGGVGPDLPLTRRPRRAPKRTRPPVGSFAYLVMCAIDVLGEEAYVARIEEYLAIYLHADVDPAQVYVTAKRLATIGYVEVSATRSPAGTRHTVKVYSITGAGAEAMAEAAKFYAAAAALTNPHMEESPRHEKTKKAKTRPQKRKRATSLRPRSPGAGDSKRTSR